MQCFDENENVDLSFMNKFDCTKGQTNLNAMCKNMDKVEKDGGEKPESRLYATEPSND